MKEVELFGEGEDENSRKAAFLDSFEQRYRDEFLPDNWTEDKKSEIMQIMDKNTSRRALMTGIPMVCRGSACQFASNCPLQQKREAPVNFPCPYEMSIVKNTMEDFIETLGVDRDNGVEMLLVRDMVNQEVQQHRATKLLAQESFIQENVVGVDAEGDPVMRKELHLSVDYEDKIFKRRTALFKLFNATREAKAKHAAAIMNSAEGMAAVMGKYQKTIHAKDQSLLALMGLADKDDYIDAKSRELEEAKEKEQ